MTFPSSPRATLSVAELVQLASPSVPRSDLRWEVRRELERKRQIDEDAEATLRRLNR